MFVNFADALGNSIYLRKDIIWAINKLKDSDNAEVLLEGGKVSVKVSYETADGLIDTFAPSES